MNIYPQELEQAIEEMAEISECAVVAMPDADFGERPAAFLVPAKGVLSGARTGDELVEAVRAFAKQRLGRTKQPYQLFVVEELPRSEAGKLLRRALKDRLPAAARQPGASS